MNENLIRKKIKAKVEDFNSKQESLKFHMYLFKGALVLILFLLFIVISPVIAAILTPLFMGNGPASDAIAISYSAIGVSFVVVGSVIYFATKKKRQVLDKNPDQDNTFDFYQPPKNRINRFLSFFPFVNNFISFIILLFVKPFKPHPPIYLDPNSYNIIVDLLIHLSAAKNFLVEYEYLDKYSSEFSPKWIANLIKKIETLEIIKVFLNDTDKKFILLNLEFYDPSDER